MSPGLSLRGSSSGTDALVTRSLADRFGAMPVNWPELVIWDLTYACPLRCAHCYSESGRRASQQMGAEALWNVARAIANLGPRAVSFSGGEPLLVPTALEMAEYLEKEGILVRLYTSGAYRTEEIIDRSAAAVSQLVVSIDGGTAPTHDRLRGRTGSFKAALSFLRELALRKKRGVCHRQFQIWVECMLVKSNLREAELLCRLVGAPGFGVDHVSFAPAMPVGLGSRPSFVDAEILTEDDLARIREPSYVGQLHASLPRNSLTRVTVQDNAVFSDVPEDRAAGTNIVHVEPSGRVRAIPIYEGTVASVLEDDAETIRVRIEERVREPRMASLLRSIGTYSDWASAARQIDLRYAAPEDVQRIRRRSPYVDQS